jgi:hypothetical protein
MTYQKIMFPGEGQEKPSFTKATATKAIRSTLAGKAAENNLGDERTLKSPEDNINYRS